MSSGSVGAGGLWLKATLSSQSRTNCLSRLGGLAPVLYSAAGQKREESGVRTSSPRTSVPFASVPNSNFVSAMMMPRVAAYSAARV